MLRFGRQYGEGLLEAAVTPSPDPLAVLRVDMATLTEPGQQAVTLFGASSQSLQKKFEPATWGNVAQAQVKAVAALLKTTSGGE